MGAEFRLSGEELDEMGNKLAKREDSEERPWLLRPGRLLSFSFLEEEEAESLGMDLLSLVFFVGVGLLGDAAGGRMGAWREVECTWRLGGRES